jgi:hypothetical protein
MLKLEDLQVDTHVAGIEPLAPVKVLYVQKAGPDALNVTYELLNGQVLKKALFRADEEKLSVASTTRIWGFDAKPEKFNLAAEATRIRLAHLFDPMMAIHTSDVEPLPHQISAVYKEVDQIAMSDALVFLEAGRKQYLNAVEYDAGLAAHYRAAVKLFEMCSGAIAEGIARAKTAEAAEVAGGGAEGAGKAPNK